jgi:nucleoid-associated protein YgaU
MLGDRYTVVHGDNLWKIAAKSLGGGKQWPRIWRYNNRPEVARVTGRGIPNPDLIYVGQRLLIPRLRPSA